MQLSVIVPTFRRQLLLENLLHSLTAQVAPAELFEVIVVSDGPDADTARMIARLSGRSALQIRHLALPEKAGPAAARNLGWKSAAAPLVAFIDDDCLAGPEWVSCWLSIWGHEPLAAFTGKVIVPLPDLPRRPTDYQKNVAGLETAEFITANCCCTLKALQLTGGFDERFKIAWREDSDLQFKLLGLGLQIMKVEEAIVIHPVRPAPWGISVKEQRKSMYEALLYKCHPALYRARVAAQPPVLYYMMLVSLSAALVLMAEKMSVLVLLPWFILVVYFTYRRLTGTSTSLSHIAEMLVTSAVIPILSIYWRLYGAVKFRTCFI